MQRDKPQPGFLHSRPDRVQESQHPERRLHDPFLRQALGTTFVAIGVVLLVVGVRPWGWLPVAAVVALQTLLAVTGYCLGCKLYFLRWWVPSVVTGLWRRQASATIERTPLRYS